MDILKIAKEVFDTEIKALVDTSKSIDEVFVSIVEAIVSCKGKVVVSGIGKPGHIGRKISATLASLGTPSFFLHPAEGLHGDLGMVSADDVIILLSYSGESQEIVTLLPVLKMIGAKVIAITGNANSSLAQYADIVQVFPEFNEACNLGLAPTSSTTVELVYGDALAIVASRIYGYKDSDFARIHPAGSLGKKLFVKVRDIMLTGDEMAIVNINSKLKSAIIEISNKELGMTVVINDREELVGILTSGDIRRCLEKDEIDLNHMVVSKACKFNPLVAKPDDMAIDILKKMTEVDVVYMPVTEGKKVVGIIRIKDIIKQGIYL